MKKTILFIVLLQISMIYTVQSRDLIHLKDGSTVKGQIIELKQDEVVISRKLKRSIDISTYSSEEVKLIEFDARNVDILRLIIHEISQQKSMCNEGFRDATLYHRRFFGNFVLGLAFNIFGFAAVAISNPKIPDPAIINDSEKLMSTEYLLCYEKKAKKKNIKAAGIGLITIVILVFAAR